MHAQAIVRLDAGDIRDAAEKAWCATKRATDALILARTGDDPGTTAATSDGLDDLARRDPGAKSLQGRYYSRIHQLHCACFYDGRFPGHGAAHPGNRPLYQRCGRFVRRVTIRSRRGLTQRRKGAE